MSKRAKFPRVSCREGWKKYNLWRPRRFGESASAARPVYFHAELGQIESRGESSCCRRSGEGRVRKVWVSLLFFGVNGMVVDNG